MKTRKLLKMLANFMDKDRTSQRDELATIREVLKKLKAKEHKLREKLKADPDDDERREIEDKLSVVHAQRTKGLERVRQIRNNQRAPAATTSDTTPPPPRASDPPENNSS